MLRRLGRFLSRSPRSLLSWWPAFRSTLGFKKHIPMKDDGDSLVNTVIQGGQEYQYQIVFGQC